MTALIVLIMIIAAAFALGYLFGDIGGEARAYRQFIEANRSPHRREHQ